MLGQRRVPSRRDILAQWWLNVDHLPLRRAKTEPPQVQCLVSTLSDVHTNTISSRDVWDNVV